MNLVSLIMQFLGPALVAKLASSLGINQTVAHRLLAAAVPAILAALAGKVAQPGGARALFDILAKQDPGVLGKLAAVIGGSQQNDIAAQGNNVLGSLLGGPALGALTGALAKFGGVAETPAKGLLGVLAPVMLGTLGQQQKSQGLDAAGVAKFLADQKGNIASALPGDFAKLLAGTGLLDAVLPAPATAGKPAATVVSPGVAKPSAPPAPTAAPRTGAFNWWPWIVIIGLAAAAWLYWFAARPQMTSLPPVPRIMAGTSDLGATLETSLTGLQGLLAGVKDVASAQSALPRLRETQSALDRIGSTSGLSPDARKAMAGYVAAWLPTLTPYIVRLLGDTAIGPVLRPVLEALRTRLEAMAKA